LACRKKFKVLFTKVNFKEVLKKMKQIAWVLMLTKLVGILGRVAMACKGMPQHQSKRCTQKEMLHPLHNSNVQQIGHFGKYEVGRPKAQHGINPPQACSKRER